MKKTVTALIACALLATACKKIDVDNSIPDCKVLFKTTTTSEYNHLQTPGSYAVYSEKTGNYPVNTYLGYGGLVIFRDFNGTLRCADLACPYCYSQEQCCYRIVPNSSLLATCENCRSIYNLQWGVCAPTEGPSKEPLKIYTHCTDNGTYIRVTY